MIQMFDYYALVVAHDVVSVGRTMIECFDFCAEFPDIDTVPCGIQEGGSLCLVYCTEALYNDYNKNGTIRYSVVNRNCIKSVGEQVS